MSVTGTVRPAISGGRLAGAFRSAQGALHRPAPLFCWGKTVLFPFIAFCGVYFITVFTPCQAVAAALFL